jgi:hypothetical protein
MAGMGDDVCAIESTETGAIAAAVRCKPELLIVDASLREGSGVSAVEEILRAGVVPHLFISGETTSVRARMPGAVVLQKPCRDSDLAWTVQRALGVATAGMMGDFDEPIVGNNCMPSEVASNTARHQPRAVLFRYMVAGQANAVGISVAIDVTNCDVEPVFHFALTVGVRTTPTPTR